MFLGEIDRLARARSDFSFESTLSGRSHIERMRLWSKTGYRLEIIYLKLESVTLALKRIAGRVKEGGHDVPATDVTRRFTRSWHNFQHIYAPLSDAWWVYDAGSLPPTLVTRFP